MNPQIKIIQIPPDRWEEYRNLRLTSLHDNPIPFASSKEEEENLTEEDWKKRLENKSNFNVFAEEGGTLIGKMEIRRGTTKKVEHTAEIFGVYVDPKYRGQGIGEMLMSEVERIARNKGIEKLHLTVVASQTSPLKLYLKCGFKEKGKFEKQMKIKNEYYDEVYMEKFI